MTIRRKKWPRGWRGWRRISQAFFLILFVYLAARTQVSQGFSRELSILCQTGQDLRLSSPVTFFFDLDPLVSLGSMLATWSLKPPLILSLLVLLAVILMGQVFCGFVCPFGALNQLVNRFGAKRRSLDRTLRNQSRPSHRIKYYLLALCLLAALLGSNQTGLLDPLSFLFRGLVLAVFPAADYLIGQAGSWLADWPRPWSYLSYVGPYVFDPVLGYGLAAYAGAFIMGGLLLTVLLLNVYRPRFFCRVLCPLGALLGLFSRYSVLNLTKDEARCTQCGRCQVHCPGACGPHPDETWLRYECHVCFNCEAECPEGALEFRFQFHRAQPDPSPKPAQDAPDLGRRAVLASLAGGIAWAGLGRSSLATPQRPEAALIRPPGALEETEFLKRCVRCGLCMRVCPTNVINPTLGEAGWEGVWTPVLNFNQGYCEYSCTLCSSVCPTGAIRPITAKEKAAVPIVIGSAFIDRGRCLPWSGQGPCIVCEEHCPVSPKAIYLTPLEVTTDPGKTAQVMTPQINLTRCIGCGICSYKCPIKGAPAIYVRAVGESRSPSNRILLPEKKG